MAEGKIFLFESMGLVDGPGIRVVVFFQGCPLSCSFCHNPESRPFSGGEAVSSSDLMKKILRFRPYFERSGGGVTFSGGEPLMQPEFLLEMLKLCKDEGIHTCLDTSGVGCGSYEEILSLCDTVLYDIKAINKDSYKEICKNDITKTEIFQKELNKSGAEIIIRQVVIPGINDTEEYMKNLRKYIKEKIPRASKVELLPFHKMGEHKYKKAGLVFPLTKIPPMDKERTKVFEEKYFKDMEER